VSAEIRGWHFCTMRGGEPILRDGIPLAIGEWLPEIPEPALCKRGYHASERAIDALRYAPGPWVSRVTVRGCVRGDDKVVGSTRRHDPGFDATSVLRAFARRCALDVAHLWDMPAVVRSYLESGDKSMRAAAAAATAASAAATEAAWYATRSGEAMAIPRAAHAAASAVAWSTAWSAARSAARDAAGAAACNVDGAAATNAVWNAAWNTAWSAARDAARDAARAAQGAVLESMLLGMMQ